MSVIFTVADALRGSLFDVFVTGTASVKICGKTLTTAEWLAVGTDPGTTVTGGLSSDDIMALGAAILGF